MARVGKTTSLLELNVLLLHRVLELFDATTSGDLPVILPVSPVAYARLVSDDKTEHLSNLLQTFTPNYTQYNSGAGGKNYLDTTKLRNVKFQSLPPNMSQDSILSWISQFGSEQTVQQLKTLGEWHDK